MLIRIATPADVPQIIALEREASTAAHWSEREYQSLFAPEAPLRIATVACQESAGELISGFLITRCVADEWEIENLVTAAGLRRRGIASALVRDGLQQARRHGVTSVLLEVRESNLPARRLYQELGFLNVGRRPNYYREPQEDALLLRLVLQEHDKTP